MQGPEDQPVPARLRTPLPAAVTAIIGLTVAAISLMVFVLDLLATPEIGSLLTSFVVCGVGLTTGFIVLRRLLPRRKPETLFAGSCGVIVPDAPRFPASSREAEYPPEANRGPSRAHSYPEIAPVMKSHGSESIATYKTHEGAGVATFVTVAGVAIILAVRLDFGRQFLSLALLAGGAMALVLYWLRERGQNSKITIYTRPVSGGTIGVAVIIGLGLVMARFRFMRDFLALTIAGGGAVAFILSRARRRRESISLSI